MDKVVVGLVLLTMAMLVGMSLVYGVNKTLDNMDRTYYDTELERTVYIEEGV